MQTICKKTNGRLHLLLQKAGLKEDVEAKRFLVRQYTNQRTASSREMLEMEAVQLCKHLEELTPVDHAPKGKESNALRKPMRGKIIHYMCLLGYTKADGTADWARIDKFIQNIGSNNPRKVILNYLWYDELLKVLTQVEQMYLREVRKASRDHNRNYEKI